MIQLGLTGYPLSHSLSPRLHTAFLRACNLQGAYSLYPVDPNDTRSLEALLHRIRTGELTGLNVTIPYKQIIIQFMDELSATASAIGAVNTISLKDGKMIGDNTDAAGFLTDLNRFLQADPHYEKTNLLKGKSALILGAGGSARAAAHALYEAGWTITLAARHIEQARDFAIPHTCIIHYEPSQISPILSTTRLIVNATPVGMFPHTGASVWIEGLDFPKGAVVYDLIYNPRETVLVKQARAAGLRAITGMGMLVEQAALAFQIWTGRKIPGSILFDAIKNSEN